MTQFSLKAAGLGAFILLAVPAAADTMPAQEAATVQTVETTAYAVRPPKEDKVTYKGVVNFDNAGVGTGPMMYPAPNLAGLVVGILAHAAVTESVKDNQKSKLQLEADKVLAPYEEILNGYTNRELLQSAIEKTTIGKDKTLLDPSSSVQPGKGMILDSAPVFSMTQDQSAIVLDNAVAISDATSPSNTIRQYVIRVVARPRDEQGIVDFWKSNQGVNLKEESANLLAMSLDIALAADAAPQNDNGKSYKTVRYWEGKTEKMERAQILDRQCNRLLIKNLKGWLLSVPDKQSTSGTETPETCDKKKNSDPPALTNVRIARVRPEQNVIAVVEPA